MTRNASKDAGWSRLFRVSFALVLAAGFVAGGALSANAATVYSTWTNWVSGSSTYSTRGYLTDSGTYGGQTKLSSGAVSPAGYLGSSIAVYTGTTVCGSAGPLYNGSPLVAQIVSGSSYSSLCGGTRAFYAKGTGYAYNPATGGYVTKAGLASPLKTLTH